MGLIIALGSNIGDKKQNLLNALNELILEFGKPNKVSHIYLSKAYGVTDQDDFYNAAVEFSLPDKTPQECLSLCLSIEEKLGRKRIKKWGPRNIDIDILFYSTQSIDEENLSIPHPFIGERDFVLLPLYELPYFAEFQDKYPLVNESDSCKKIDSFLLG